jgi:hypothetical protein
MNTLMEFIVETKFYSYVAAVVLMVGFIPFWKFLIQREK